MRRIFLVSLLYHDRGIILFWTLRATHQQLLGQISIMGRYIFHATVSFPIYTEKKELGNSGTIWKKRENTMGGRKTFGGFMKYPLVEVLKMCEIIDDEL